MKIKTYFQYPNEYRRQAEAYVSYKKSLGFSVGYEEQRKLNTLFHFLYNNALGNDVTLLTKELVESYLEQFSHTKARTIHSYQSLIRQYGLFLKLNGYSPYIVPNKLIHCPKDFTPYIFSPDEIYRVLACADQIGPNKNKFINTPYIYPAILRTLYACGSRIGETVRLKVNDVDLMEGTITFHNGKNNISRIIPISDSLLSYLRKYDKKVVRDENSFFFPALHNECYSPNTIYNVFVKLMKQADIPHLSNGKYPRLHDLRHTFAVHALEQSVKKGLDPYCSLPALSIYMGHKGIESTEYYLRLTKHYFINVLSYTEEQANKIFPEV